MDVVIDTMVVNQNSKCPHLVSLTDTYIWILNDIIDTVGRSKVGNRNVSSSL